MNILSSIQNILKSKGINLKTKSELEKGIDQHKFIFTSLDLKLNNNYTHRIFKIDERLDFEIDNLEIELEKKITSLPIKGKIGEKTFEWSSFNNNNVISIEFGDHIIRDQLNYYIEDYNKKLRFDLFSESGNIGIYSFVLSEIIHSKIIIIDERIQSFVCSNKYNEK